MTGNRCSNVSIRVSCGDRVISQELLRPFLSCGEDTVTPATTYPSYRTTLVINRIQVEANIGILDALISGLIHHSFVTHVGNQYARRLDSRNRQRRRRILASDIDARLSLSLAMSGENRVPRERSRSGHLP